MATTFRFEGSIPVLSSGQIEVPVYNFLGGQRFMDVTLLMGSMEDEVVNISRYVLSKEKFRKEDKTVDEEAWLRSWPFRIRIAGDMLRDENGTERSVVMLKSQDGVNYPQAFFPTLREAGLGLCMSQTVWAPALSVSQLASGPLLVSSSPKEIVMVADLFDYDGGSPLYLRGARNTTSIGVGSGQERLFVERYRDDHRHEFGLKFWAKSGERRSVMRRALTGRDQGTELHFRFKKTEACRDCWGDRGSWHWYVSDAADARKRGKEKRQGQTAVRTGDAGVQSGS